MSKDKDIDDLLGEAPKGKKAAKAAAPKADAKKAAAPAKPETKADAKKADTKKAAAPKADAKKAAAPAKGKKAADDDDLLGGKSAKKAATPAKDKAPRVREPIEFEEGEKDKLIKLVGKAVQKGPKSSRDLATNLGIKTRKLRQVLYSMQRQGVVRLELGGARAQGMTVHAAT